MGQEDYVVNRYIAENDRFADLFNGSIFGGEQVIRAGDLMDASEKYEVKKQNSGWKSRIRDIRKYLKNGSLFQILALENQSYISYTAPFRHMEYDSLEYRRQIDKITTKNRKAKLLKNKNEWLSGLTLKDRLIPVYTLVLYWGYEPWNGPRDLKDMMNFDGNSKLESLFCNYPMHLICMNEEEHYERYRTDLRDVFRILKYREDKKKLRQCIQEYPVYAHLSEETYDMLSVVLRDRNIVKVKNAENMQKQEVYNLKSIIDEMLEDEREEGRKEGREASKKQIEELKLENERLRNRIREMKKGK